MLSSAVLPSANVTLTLISRNPVEADAKSNCALLEVVVTVVAIWAGVPPENVNSYEVTVPPLAVAVAVNRRLSVLAETVTVTFARTCTICVVTACSPVVSVADSGLYTLLGGGDT